MAEHDTSWVVPWPAATAGRHTLRLWIDETASKAGWQKAFKNGYLTFNKLCADWNINVAYDLAADKVNSEVIAYAAGGDIDFNPGGKVTRETIAFDPTSVHGLTKTVYDVTTSRGVTTTTINRCYIYVPKKAGLHESKSDRQIGEGVREFIAVHELIHAAGVGDGNKRHSDNDVFAWPLLKMGAKPDDDKMMVATGNRVPMDAQHPKIIIWEKELQPPIKMRSTTAQWLTDIWGLKPSA